MKKIAFEIEVNGIKTVLKNEQDLINATKAVNKAFKESDYGSAERKKLGVDLGKLKKLQADNRQEVRDLAREYEITADKGRDSYRSINAELVNARRAYKDLSRAERDTFGPALITRIGKLDAELKELDSNMGQYQRNVGNYSSAFDGVGGALLDLGGIDLAALANPATAVVAVGAAAIAGAAALKEMTEQVRAVRGEVQNFTNTGGAELDELTARVQAVSDTFGVTTNEVNNAANAAAKQLGISFDDALTQIETGFTAGLNANGELLDSTREYATFFADAFGPGEAAANALFETIKRGNEQGIFNDKAVDAVKEVTTRLRRLPSATKDALGAIGLASDDIAKQIKDEGIGSAIATVSTRLGELERNSPEVGQAMADIFGGPGEDAGFDFLVSLQDINTATGVTIDQGNEYQVQQARTLKVNQEFSRAQVEVANAFGATGSSMDDLLIQGQTLLLRFLVPVIDTFRSWFKIFEPLVDAGLRLGRAMGILGPETDAVGAFTSVLGTVMKAALSPLKLIIGAISGLTDAFSFVLEKGNEFKEFLGFAGKEAEVTGKKTDFAAEQFGKLAAQSERAKKEAEKAKKELKKTKEEVKDLGEETKKTAGITEKFAESSLSFLKKKLTGLKKDLAGAVPGDQKSILYDIIGVEKAIEKIKKLEDETKKTAIITEKFAEGSLSFLKKKLTGLNKDLAGAVPGDQKSILSDIIGVEQAIEKIKDSRAEIRNEIGRTADDIKPIDLIKSPIETIGQVKSTNTQVLTEQDDFSKKLNRSREDNTKRHEDRIARDLSAEEEKAARIAEITGTVFSAFNGINDALAQSSQSRSDAELRAVQDRYAGEIEAAEGNEDLQEELREQQAVAELAIRQDELEQQKKFRIASARASQAEGIINILTAPTTIPDPFGTIFKGLRIAALSVQTQLQIGNIKRQQVAAKGAIVDGWIRGESHNGPNGGTSLNLNGRSVLAEAGEFTDYDEYGAAMVVNKRSAAAHAPALNRMHGVTFPGKRAMFSQINTDRGHGIPFMQSGGLLEPNMSGLAAINSGMAGSSSSRAVQISADSIAMIATATGQAVRAGAAEGTAEGASDANRRRDREERLRTKTG